MFSVLLCFRIGFFVVEMSHLLVCYLYFVFLILISVGLVIFKIDLYCFV